MTAAMGPESRSDAMEPDRSLLSVVVPIYNEEENIPLVHTELKYALEQLRRSYEIIYVDDGSTDASARRLEKIASADPTVTVIRFRRNHGQTAAIALWGPSPIRAKTAFP